MKPKFTTIVLSVALSIVVCSGTLCATDYFVSPSGSDTNGDGSIGNPWQTLLFAIDKLNQGDVLYLRAGVYHEQLMSVRSGTPSAYITISTYNDEDAFIDGDGVTTGNNGCLLSHSYMKFRGFTVRNWRDDGMSFRNCEFIELIKVKVTSTTGGISMKGTMHDFVLDSCIMHDYYGGAGGYGFDATPEGATDRIYNGMIKNSKAYITAGAFDNCDGFALGHDGVSDITISNCEAYGIGDAFDISGSGIVLERCVAHNSSYGGGYKLWRDNVTMINCVGYDNPVNVELDFDNGTHTGVKAKLINCTFYGCRSANVYIENTTGGSTLEMYNCILAGGENTGLTFDGDNIAYYTGDYNLFHMNAPVRAIATSQYDFSLTQIQAGDWTTFSQQDAHSKVEIDANTLFQDTLKSNPDLHLKTGSIAVNNGAAVAGAPTNDFDNRPRSDGMIDIGAYEYSSATEIGRSTRSILADGLMLEQSYPNPLSTSGVHALISFTLSSAAHVRLSIVDNLGREVTVLVNEMKERGTYQAHYNPASLPSGTYYYVLRSSGSSVAKKLMIVR